MNIDQYDHETIPSVAEQLPDGSLWCSTVTGRLAAFKADIASDLSSSFLSAGEFLPDRLLIPRCALNFRVTLLKVNPSKKSALLAGYNGNCPQLSVATIPEAVINTAQTESYNYITLSGDFIFNRPGMQLNQIRWWPGDDPHCFVVLSGNCLGIYNAHSLSVPVATYRLQMSKLGEVHNQGNAVDVTFVREAKGWNVFTVCILRDDGNVFFLCPITVPGLLCDGNEIKQLLNEQSSQTVQHWYRCVFSRTRLNEIRTDSTDTLIKTRDHAEAYTYTPNIQTSKTLINSTSKRSFTSIAALGNDLLAVASTCGKLWLLKIPSMTPSFSDQSARTGAPHLMLLQDCHPAASTVDVESLPQISFPVSSSNELHLITNHVECLLAVSTASHTVLVNYSEPEYPLSVVLSNSVLPDLGVMISRRVVVLLQKLVIYRMPYSTLKPESTHHTNVPTQPVPDVDTQDTIMDEDEANLLERIEGLRRMFVTQNDAISDQCTLQQERDEQILANTEQVHQAFSQIVNDPRAESVSKNIDQERLDLVKEARTLIRDLDPSVSMMDSVQIQKRMNDFGIK